jgi:hypothetical protein
MLMQNQNQLLKTDNFPLVFGIFFKRLVFFFQPNIGILLDYGMFLTTRFQIIKPNLGAVVIIPEAVPFRRFESPKLRTQK